MVESVKWGPYSMSYFEMITSQQGTRIARFQENSFINEYPTSKLLLLLIFIFCHHSFVHKIWGSTFSRANFGLMASHGELKLQNFEIVVSKTNTSTFPSIFSYYQLSSFLSPLVHEIQVWTLFDPFLGYWRQHMSQNCNLLRN